MKTVEEIALEVAKSYTGNYEHQLNYVDFATRFLAAVDAERGKDAVGWMWQHEDTGNMGVVDQWQIDNGWEEGNPRIHIIGPVFLSPTIPLGFALVPIDPSEEWIAKVARVNQPDLYIGCRAWREEVESLEYWHKAMIQAAGVTKC